MSAHDACTHPKTKSARAACRKANKGTAPKVSAERKLAEGAGLVKPLPTAIQTPIAETPAVMIAAEGVREISLSGRIDSYQLSETLARVAKINERAAKKGLAGTLAVEYTEIQLSEKDLLTGLIREWVEYDIQITGNAPAHNGWEFIAKLDWDANAGLIVRAMPGAIQANRDALREGWCDHCKITRRRNVTYVVRNIETGETVQVGSSCIKDFTGWAGSVAFLDSEPQNEAGFFGTRELPEYSPLTVLSVAWACIKLNGFRPARHDGRSTREDVMAVLYPNVKNAKEMEFARSIRPLADEAEKTATKILEWVLSNDGDNDYLMNLRSVAGGKLVSMRNIGLLASAPQAYAKSLERTLVREREASIYAASEYVGNIKERFEMGVVVKSVRYIEGEYGTSTLYTMLDTAGNVIKWFASSDKLGDTEGATAVIKATVKRHEEYNGTKITHVTRAAVIEFTEAPDAEDLLNA
jgi:hypothetical protein